MPKIVVEIEWDQPDDENWLCPDNVALALHAYCKNTKFRVRSFDCKMLKTEADYDAALAHAETLMDAAPDSPEERELGVFALLINEYEQAHYAIDPPDPLKAIECRMSPLRTRCSEVLDKFWRWLAWLLPHQLAMWAALRVAAHATTGQYGDTEVPKLTAMDAILRWDIKVARARS